MAESKYGIYFVTDLKAPQMAPEAAAKYNQFARRILRIDETIAPGSFQMSCSWYVNPNAGNSPDPHRHDCDEIIGFIGNNPEDPSDLGGEVEFWMEDEMHVITKSCLIFVPKGVKHCPLVVRRADRPIFHFSTVTSGQYTQVKE